MNETNSSRTSPDKSSADKEVLDKEALNKEALEQLSPEQKRALLARLLEEKRKTAGQPAATAQRFPLTPAQRRLWFIDRLQPENPAYNMPVAMRLRGRLRIEPLQWAIDALVARHEALRTRFVDEEGTPWQIVRPQLSVKLATRDLRGAGDPESAVAGQLDTLVKQRFDLAGDPLLRCLLLRLADEEYILAVVIHHIVMDFTSLEIMMKEVLALYHGRTEGREAALPPLRIQYPDYAVWLNGREAELSQQLAYWRQQLAGAPELLPLPADYPRPPRPNFAGRRHNFSVDGAVFTALTTLAKHHQATPFMVTLACFQALLHRYTGAPDLCVGSTLSNRDQEELRHLIGLFINTLVFRMRLERGLSFRQLLERVKETALNAYANQDVPFERVVEALDIERSLSHNALFQVTFNLHTLREERAPIPGLEISPVEFTNRSSRFDLGLDLYHRGGEGAASVQGFIEYNTDLFTPATIDRMAGHFNNLLAAVAADPDCAISALPLLSDREQHQLLVDWNRTEAPVPANEAGLCLQQLIEQQVEKTPEAVAVRCGDRQLNYRQFNQRVNRLAAYLRQRGVGRGDRVGVCLPPSPDALVAVLAVMKAGGAYVPMDISYPSGRLRHMATDAQLSLLLTAQPWRHLLAWDADAVPAPVLHLDSDTEMWQHLPEENPPLINTPEDLLYLIYTSGSTGLPKGAGVRHRNGINLLTWYTRAWEMGPADRTLIISALGFDLTQKNLFAPLTVGGAVVFPELPRYDPVHILQQLEQQAVTLMNCAPSAFYPLAERAEHWPQLRSLRCLLLGGESIQLPLVKPWLAQSRCQLVNLYGPTECTSIAASYTVQATDLDNAAARRLPIGRPNSNVKLYVLDEHSLQPVPVGVAGELCIGGAGVGCGYFNNDELTRAAFIDNPFGAGRLYRSGDLVRYRADGNLEFISRIDTQVKIRGLRIEPGEIEAALNAQAEIEQAVVQVRRDSNGEAQLVAWCVPHAAAPAAATAPLSDREIRVALSEYLPGYMVPRAYVWLSELPLNANGKIDRGRLPEPELAPPRETKVEAPKTATETLLADIWSDVLGTVSIGRDDNFFHIGGHSILAARVIARLQPTFEVTVPMHTLFEHPTLREFALVVDNALARDSGAEIRRIDLEPQPRDRALPLSYAQQRQWVLAQMEPDNPYYNMPSAVRLKGPLSRPLLARSFALLSERQEVLRTRFPNVRGRALLEILPSAQPHISFLDLTDPDLPRRRAAGGDGDWTEKALYASLRQESARPFDLERAPPLRVHLVKTAADEHVLLVVVHHIIGDALSNGILVREVSQIYRHLLSQQRPPQQQFSPPAALEPLPLQYADFAAWQRSLNLEKPLAYWQKQLAGAPPLLALPTDFPRPASQGFAGASVRFALGEAQTRALRALGNSDNATLFLTLLAAFNVLLHRYSEMDDIVVGIPASDRPHRDLENVLGLFLNTLALRTRIQPWDTFTSVLKQVRHTALAAYAHQDAPFEQVLDALAPPRSGGHNPLFQAMFVWKTRANADASIAAGDGGDLRWEPVILEDTTAKVDLALIMTESAGGVTGKFAYRVDLFRRETIEGMVKVFSTLLDTLAENPGQTIVSLTLPRAARQQPERAATPAADKSGRGASPEVREADSAEPDGVMRNDVERRIANVWARVLQLQTIERHDNFFALGGDSILVIQAVAELREEGLHLTPKDLFEYATIAELAAIAPARTRLQADQGPVVGSVPMTAIQHWFFDLDLPARHHWNQTILLNVQRTLDTGLMERALQRIMDHHDALRARFERRGGMWEQSYLAPGQPVPFRCVRRRCEEHAAEITRLATDVQGGFNLGDGPLWQCVYLELETPETTQRRLLFSCHHLLVDGISWRILLADLQNLYTQLEQAAQARLAADAVKLPAKTTSCQTWTQRLQRAAAEGAFDGEIDYWRAVVAEKLPAFPFDFEGTRRGADRRGDGITRLDSVSVVLDTAATDKLLHQVPSAYKARSDDLLLTALLLALEPRLGERRLRLQMESHGRPDLFDDIDLTRTLGWLTALYPVLLDARSARGLGDMLKAVKQTLRAVPNLGIGYGVLRYYHPQRDGEAPAIPIRFNYLGQTDTLFDDRALFVPAQEATGPSQSPENPRDVALNISAVTLRNQLRIQWAFDTHLLARATVERMASDYLERLNALIDYCLSEQADGGFIAADFPQMDMEQDEFEALLESL